MDAANQRELTVVKDDKRAAKPHLAVLKLSGPDNARRVFVSSLIIKTGNLAVSSTLRHMVLTASDFASGQDRKSSSPPAWVCINLVSCRS